jgi:hypothetical protein
LSIIADNQSKTQDNPGTSNQHWQTPHQLSEQFQNDAAIQPDMQDPPGDSRTFLAIYFEYTTDTPKPIELIRIFGEHVNHIVTQYLPR